MITFIIGVILCVLFIGVVIKCQLLDCKENKHDFGQVVDDYYDWEQTGITYCHRVCKFCGHKQRGYRL